MKKALDYETLTKIWLENWKVGAKLQHKAAKLDALSIGLIEQAASAKTEIDCINATANFAANFSTKSYTIISDWFNTFNRDFADMTKEILYPDFSNKKPFTVGEYLDLIARKAPSEKDAFTNFDNAILA